MCLVHEGGALQPNGLEPEHARIGDQLLKNRRSDTETAEHGSDIHSLDLSFLTRKRPHPADSDRLVVDLGEVQPRRRRPQVLQVGQKTRLALGLLQLDPILRFGAAPSPIRELGRQKNRGAQVFVSLDHPQPDLGTTHRH
jgi:hypothetical protein